MANGKRPRCEYHTSPYLSIVQARVMKGNDLAFGSHENEEVRSRAEGSGRAPVMWDTMVARGREPVRESGRV